jgi:hypothetical protein
MKALPPYFFIGSRFMMDNLMSYIFHVVGAWRLSKTLGDRLGLCNNDNAKEEDG